MGGRSGSWRGATGRGRRGAGQNKAGARVPDGQTVIIEAFMSSLGISSLQLEGPRHNAPRSAQQAVRGRGAVSRRGVAVGHSGGDDGGGGQVGIVKSHGG